ncbi:MAG: tetratricopeptide repeat protein [Longimicrobiales bacterium]|nr:tetratricopeptide repeat protein [Longimicrobiales bacterium]
MTPTGLPGEPRSRRTFSELPKGKRLRDSDLGQDMVVLRSVTSGLYGGGLGGLLAFWLVQNGAPWWLAALCPVGGWLAVTLVTLAIANSAGSAASTLYNPSSGAPPRKKEHSHAESLVARGLYEDAVGAFEVAVKEDPSDPTPYLRIARVYRDHLGRHEDAARWFRRAVREASAPPGAAFLARKELVELYTHRMGTPERALPELARMAEELAGTQEGDWATAQIREIKARMSEGGSG